MVPPLLISLFSNLKNLNEISSLQIFIIFIISIFQILNAGHSRVPVYDKSNDKIVGILLVKSIIKLNPEDAIPVSVQMNKDGFLSFTESEPLYNILNAFQTGRSNLLFIFDNLSEFDIKVFQILISYNYP